ncbi:MAG: hypothetical protein Ct9H300mP13_2610 [Gammaproteobacteria bacterium]|nr:MAG: hypothetical protein Ct9H300mP13_2610 [Gammaproteobacteria bacterium]
MTPKCHLLDPEQLKSIPVSIVGNMMKQPLFSPTDLPMIVIKKANPMPGPLKYRKLFCSRRYLREICIAEAPVPMTPMGALIRFSS